MTKKIDRMIRTLSIVCVLLTTMFINKLQAETKYINGYLYGSHKWVASNTYILNGFTYVMNNAVLDIEAGTVVKGASGSGTSGNAANDFGCLFVCRGGKVNAIGTEDKPIIFTAEVDDVSDNGDLPFPTRGLWGGVVLFGNGRINNPGWTTNNVTYDIYEGLPDLVVTNSANGQVDFIHRYGGNNDDDSSGVFKYVSVRHGGKKLTTDKEINGWSMGAVGRGTTMEYLEAYCIADDGFEFFGGSVNTKYLVSAFNDDDGFDTDQGYNGKNQYWFGIQEAGAKDNGAEQNGQPQPPDVKINGALPLANYVVKNATFIGAGVGTSANDALRFRQENKSGWYNSIFTDFGGVRVRIDDDGVSTPDLKNNIFWGYKVGSNEDYGGKYVPSDINLTVDPLINGISRIQDGKLDPTLGSGSPALNTPQIDVVGLDNVNYSGAFGKVNWAHKWTALGSEGFFVEYISQPKAPVIGVVSDVGGLKLTFDTESGRKYIVQTSSTYDNVVANGVVSQNVVGYVRLSLNRGYNLIANQLVNGDNSVGSVLNVPDGTTIYKFDGKYLANSYIDGAWDSSSMKLNVGEGFFINLPSATTITLIGDVVSKTDRQLSGGINLISLPQPIVGSVVSVGQLVGSEGDVIYQWTGSGFKASEFVDGEWSPSVPSVKVGESFFLKGISRNYVYNHVDSTQSGWKSNTTITGTGSGSSVVVPVVDSTGFIRVVVE